MQHTPGPWRVVSHPNPAFAYEIQAEANGEGICAVYAGNEAHREIVDADAQLLVLAPKLLRALEDLLNIHTVDKTNAADIAISRAAEDVLRWVREVK